MNTEELLDALQSRGARLHLLDGERLGVEPSSVLTDDLRAEIRARKTELVRVLRGEPVQLAQAPASPADQLDRDWRRAMATARERFKEAGVEPDQSTLEACAWLELQFSEGWRPRQGITEEGARGLLEDAYAGRFIARIEDDATVVLREPANTKVPR